MRSTQTRPCSRDGKVAPEQWPPLDVSQFTNQPRELIAAVDGYLLQYGADYRTRLAAEQLLRATDFDKLERIATAFVDRFRVETAVGKVARLEGWLEDAIMLVAPERRGDLPVGLLEWWICRDDEEEVSC